MYYFKLLVQGIFFLIRKHLGIFFLIGLGILSLLGYESKNWIIFRKEYRWRLLSISWNGCLGRGMERKLNNMFNLLIIERLDFFCGSESLCIWSVRGSLSSIYHFLFLLVLSAESRQPLEQILSLPLQRIISLYLFSHFVFPILEWRNCGVFVLFLFFAEPCGPLVPSQGLDPCPLHWKGRVSNHRTTPPKPLECVSCLSLPVKGLGWCLTESWSPKRSAYKGLGQEFDYLSRSYMWGLRQMI